MLAAVAAFGFVAAATAGVADGAAGGIAGPSTEAYVRGAAAFERIGERLPAVAEKYGLTPGELRRMLREDATLRVDRGLELAYFDVPEPAGSAAPAMSEPGGRERPVQFREPAGRRQDDLPRFRRPHHHGHDLEQPEQNRHDRVAALLP
ncbi:MAG: hypothetical protein WKF60_09180 [Ilumatobacter sp.]